MYIVCCFGDIGVGRDSSYFDDDCVCLIGDNE